MNSVEFWIMVEKKYTIIGYKAARILLSFSTTDQCENTFSAMILIKIKHRGDLIHLLLVMNL
ncbi:hypothetical protein HZS_4198 [Henneguya salminicola]|nr:hypothetical protein HZS_4198 [Henneguya salminicola]